MANRLQRLIIPEYLALLAICLWGAAQRWYGIDRQSLWGDELYAVYHSYRGHFADLYPYMLADSHPPGYLAFMYLTLPWTDYSDTGIRLHAFIAGCLLVPVIWLTGRRFFSPFSGLIAALLLANNFNAIDYSQEARAYSILMLLSWLHVYAFMAIFIERRPTAALWLLINASGILLLYLHYASMVFVGLEAIFATALWLLQRDHRLLVDGFRAFLLPLLTFLPWLGTMIQHMTDTVYWGNKPWPERLQHVLMFFVGGNPWDWYPHIGSIAITSAAGILALRRGNPAQATQGLGILLLLILLAGPMLVFYAKSMISQPIFVERYFLASLPAAMLLAALPAAWLLERIPSAAWRWALLLSGMVIASYMQLHINYAEGLYTRPNKQPFREAVSIIRDDQTFRARPHAIFTSHLYADHYIRQMGLGRGAEIAAQNPFDVTQITRYLANHVAEHFYLLEYQPTPQTLSAIPVLDQRYQRLCITRLDYFNIAKFANRLPTAPAGSATCPGS